MSTIYSGGNLPAGRLFRSAPFLMVLWLCASVAGLALMVRYSNNPGCEGATPVRWPAQSKISPETARSTVVMFAHPRCPCTRASIVELAELAANSPQPFVAQVWFIKPAGTDSDWTNSSLWHLAAAIPGVTPHCDNAGVEAGRFHAETSGQMVVYNKNGELLFEGGITASRGHAGDNAGLSALETILKGNVTNQVRSKVFGCPLFPTPS